MSIEKTNFYSNLPKKFTPKNLKKLRFRVLQDGAGKIKDSTKKINIISIKSIFQSVAKTLFSHTPHFQVHHHKTSEDIIKVEYKLLDEKSGTETIKRINTFAYYKSLLLNQISDLDLDQKTRTKAFDKLETLANDLSNEINWVKSSDFRTLCKKVGYLQACKNYISVAPINFRIQQMKDDNGNVIARLGRLGVITDPTNGWYSIEELVQMKNELEVNNHDTIIFEHNKIEGYLQNPKPSSFLEMLKKTLLRRKIKLNDDQVLSGWFAQEAIQKARNKGSAGAEDIGKLIEDRQKKLSHQMLQYLSEQLIENQDMITDSEPFHLFHLSLLDLEIRKLDSTGWMHDESVAFKDFRFIMNEFNNKTIVFGEKGPLISENKIFLPSEQFNGFKGTVPLSTYFFNISVQGNIKNDGLQYEHNQKALDKFINKFSDSLTSDSLDIIHKMQNKGDKGGFQLAEDFGLILHDLSQTYTGAFGVNCQSGKDRTGFVSARILQRKLAKHYDVKNPHEKTILHPKGSALKLAKENVPKQKMLKIHPITGLKEGMPGFTKQEYLIKVLPKQIYQYFEH